MNEPLKQEREAPGAAEARRQEEARNAAKLAEVAKIRAGADVGEKSPEYPR
jgi:hypothetical protein